MKNNPSLIKHREYTYIDNKTFSVFSGDEESIYRNKTHNHVYNDSFYETV